MEKVNCLFLFTLFLKKKEKKGFLNEAEKTRQWLNKFFNWWKFWWQYYIDNLLFNDCSYLFWLVLFLFPRYEDLKKSFPNSQAMLWSWESQRDLWQGNPAGATTAIPSPGLAGGTRMVPGVPWGTARLWATLMPHRKDRGSLGCARQWGAPGPWEAAGGKSGA